ncbi:Cryptochrome [Pseudoalteromonas luteoviolacea B = ATCC 29581]|nr:Cryptochrome [Pseudoalteromonas luteoviolacea B = ATCC 29581]
MLLNDPHYDERHWRFVWQSLEDIDRQLRKFNTQVLVLNSSAINAFSTLMTQFTIKHVYSHQEIGLKNTFERDKSISALLKEKDIKWFEFQTGAVKRGLKNRKNWDRDWQDFMRKPVLTPNLEQANWCTLPIESEKKWDIPYTWQTKARGIQTGGSELAWRTLEDFFDQRAFAYARSISKPEASRSACSRLSPYLAWGNISIREIYQAALKHWKTPGLRRNLIAFISRLHWHCHFIQKFESECAMEHRPVNIAYLDYPYEKQSHSIHFVKAWQQGNTGIVLVDACMRALIQTGYLNFRMRAMLVSFLTHHLNVDWREGIAHLARLFLDFEPGIHYPQFQMQAGVTGSNTIRIYNPVKQAQEHDPEGVFIYKWLPELRTIPVPLLFEPHTLTTMEAMMYNIAPDSIYLNPIIDLESAAAIARERLWSYRKRLDVKKEAARILSMHVKER